MVLRVNVTEYPARADLVALDGRPAGAHDRVRAVKEGSDGLVYKDSFIVKSTRKIEITTGALFIVATTASLTAAALLPALTGADYLTGVANHSNRLTTAALLYLVAAGGSVGIAVALYPMLWKFNVGLAVGSVVFRAIEAVFYTVGVVNLLSILTLGQKFATAPAAEQATYRTLGDSLVAARDQAALAGVFAFGLGALMYYVVFHQSRLVPRWLSAWGIAAVVAMMTACLLALFHNTAVTGYVVLAAPIFIQEMVFAVWLLVKGFSPLPIRSTMSSDSGPAHTMVLEK